ncbi:hypothetical protein P4S72_00245 [Vibrio sp. PP-XX7]
MTEALIKVIRGKSTKSFVLNTDAKLDETRQTLTEPPNSFMTTADSFLNDGSPIQKGSEKLIPLNALTGTGNVLNIGSGADIGGNDGVQRYNQMSEADKIALFENIQICRGLGVDSTGFRKTFKNLYDWKAGHLPEANMPRVLTQMKQSYTFNEQTHTLETNGVQSGSVSLTTPFGGGSSNFTLAQSHSEDSKTVTEYMTQRYLSNKVDLHVSKDNLKGNPAFIEAVKIAVKGRETSIDGYESLVIVLNEWGWYIPLEFTLGGALYATRKEKITAYSQADSESQKFGADFKAEFDGIGGGAAYENSSGTKTSSGHTEKSKAVQLLQIGGKAGTSSSYTDWNASLNDSINWNTITFQQMLPSLMLLAGHNNDVLTTADYLLQKFHSYRQVATLQPYIDVSAYELRLAEMLNPFS